MLDSLEIRNFKNLSELRIEKLERVNLLTGKNNTGKSTILEAVGLYASKSDLNFIFQLLSERGENYKLSGITNLEELNIKTLCSLFTNRYLGYKTEDAITIGPLQQSLFGRQLSDIHFTRLRFIRFIDNFIEEPENEFLTNIRRKKIIPDEEINEHNGGYEIGLETRTGKNSYIYPLTRNLQTLSTQRHIGDNFQFIRSLNVDKNTNGRLWDKITLTDKEKSVIDALKILEPKIERITFIEEDSQERNAVVKLRGNNTVLPLKSMGDGINRILTIILALVNSDNGFFLIDEFENGLHYSVQEKLWEIVFTLAQELNIQVFATTHSEDCIYGFESALNSTENAGLGKLIRLDNKNGNIRQVEYDASELRIASEQHIETR